MPSHPRLGRRSLRPLLTAGVVLLLSATALTACGEGGDGSTSAGPRDSIVVVTADQASNLVRDFGYTAGSDNQEVTNSLGAQLLRKPYVEEKGANVLVQDLYTFDPFLAESYDVSDDGLVYTFHLKHGVLSQQGNELTADDVVWSFHRKFDTPGGGMAGYYAPAITDVSKQIIAVDDYTVTFTIPKAGLGFTLLGNLAENIGTIYDSDYLEEHGTKADPYAVEWGVSDMLNANIGYGPYMIDSYTPDQEIVLKANPNYVDGEPAIKTIVRRVVPEAATRANMLASGDADIATDLRPSDQADLEDNPGVFTPVATSNLYQSISLNSTKAPFDDLLVRQAFNYAVPYKDIIDDVFHGRAYLYQHLLDDKAPYYDDSNLPDYAYDPEKAKELLAEAGVTEPVEFTLTVSNVVPAVQDSAVVIAAAAKKAGFDVKISEAPAAQVFTDGAEGKLQASMSQGTAVTMSPPYQLELVTNPGGSSNTVFWEGPSFDEFSAVMEEGYAAGDTIGPKAGPKWSEAEGLMLENAGHIFIGRVMSPYSMRSDIVGYTQRTDRRIDYSVMTAGEGTAGKDMIAK